MRYLVWVTVGFGTACALGTYVLRGSALLVLLAMAALGSLFLLMKRGKRQFVPLLLVLIGVCAGCGWFYGYDLLYLQTARQADGQTAQLSLSAADYCTETEYGASVTGTVLLSGRRYQTILYLNEWIEICPGDRLEVTARLRFTDVGGEREPSYHRANGVLLIASQKSEATVTKGKSGLQEMPAILRQNLKTTIAACFPEDTRGFATALLLGDKSGLSPEASLNFRLTGLSHIVAVSGLHLSVLFALICIMTGKHRFLTVFVGIPVILLFAAVVDFTPSVTRAAIMEILMLLALLLDREYDPPTALAFAVLAMLLGNPLTVASVGFQLSVASVAGIFLFYAGIYRWFRERFRLEGKSTPVKLAKGLAAALSISISATLLTTPLVAYYFGVVSLVSLLANVIVVPVISLIFYGILLACVAGGLLPGLGRAVGWMVSWFIRYVFGATGILAELPRAAVYTQSIYIVLWLVLCYSLIGLILLQGSERIGRNLLCGLLGLCLALGLSRAEPLMDGYRVTVLSVGQGQCVLLQSRRNVFMVDCGGDSDTAAGDKAAEELLSMGISCIDGLILTHYDRDHAGGVAQLALRIGVDRVYLPRTEAENDLQETILTSLPEAERIWLDGDVEITFGTCSIHIFAPENKKSSNESCAAVLFQSEKYDTLITGDMNAAQERRLLERAELPKLELLIVGHHGSKSSTSAELVYRTGAENAAISVGRNNAYGHPAQEVLDRLVRYGCKVYRTDLMGDIVFRG